MVFLDANLFIVDRFFRRDALYPATRAFLAHLSDIPGVMPLMTLLELCGAASFLLAQAPDSWTRGRRNGGTPAPVVGQRPESS